MTSITATNPLSPGEARSLATLTLDPRLYWFRAHRHALLHTRHASAAYERAWLRGAPAFGEWHQLITAKRRADFCYVQLARQMGW